MFVVIPVVMEGGPRALCYTDSRPHFRKCGEGSIPREARAPTFHDGFHEQEPDLVVCDNGAPARGPAFSFSWRHCLPVSHMHFPALFAHSLSSVIHSPLGVSSQYLASRNPGSNLPHPILLDPKHLAKVLPQFGPQKRSMGSVRSGWLPPRLL